MKLKLKNNNIPNIIFGKVFSKKKKQNQQVMFYDYDGKILYSYTKNEFLALSDLPALPARTSENLTCDGWNWTLTEITSYLNTVDGDVNVGATYHTTDDKTHITCKPTETFPQTYICLTPSVANDVTIDWGDGTTDIWTTTSATTKLHTYTNVTDTSVYDITISCSSGTYSFQFYITGSDTNNEACVYTDIKLSNKVTSLGQYCFWHCYSLQSISIPSSVTSWGNYCFYACCSLKHINIPNSVTSCGTNCFVHCRSLQSISIPSSVTSLENNCIYGCISLKSITIPNSVTSLGINCFNGCYSLQSIDIPESVTGLGEQCFDSCCALQSIVIPENVTSIGNACFVSGSSLQKVYMKPTTPPTLSSTDAIPSNANLVIYVPSGTLSAYQNATNWSSFSSKMVEYDY